MKFLVRVDTSHTMGIGHFMRCYAIATYGQKRGHHFMFVAANLSPFATQKLANNGIELFGLECAANSGEDVRQTNDIIARTNSDYLILDGYHFDTPYRQTIDRTRAKVITIEDFGTPVSLSADIILAPGLSSPAMPFLELNPQAKILSGHRYALISEGISKYLNPPHTEQDRHALLVTFGGSDPRGLTLPTVKALKGLKLWSKIHIVVGETVADIAALQDFARAYDDEFALHINCDDMGKLMSRSGLAVTAAGNTLNELATLNTPSIAVVLADNQAANTAHLSALQVTRCIQAPFGAVPADIGAEVAFSAKALWNDKHAMKNMIAAMQREFDGRGIERIFDALEGLKTG